MLVEITSYFALPGKEQAVLEQRRRASGIRESLGLPAGQIYRKLEGPGPDVRWECRFASAEDHRKDMAARAGSIEFSEARKAMHTLVERFERRIEEMVEALP